MENQQLRKHVLYLLQGGGAHLSFDDAIADHNAYHLGQLVIVRRCLGVWEDS